MDGLSEDSPVIAVVLLADYVDRILNERPSVLVALCVFFAYNRLLGSSLDLVLFLFIASYGHISTLGWLIGKTIIVNYGLLSGTAVLATWIFSLVTRPVTTKGETLVSPSISYLIPSRITHTRICPKRHSFSYPYLMVGVHVGLGDAACEMKDAGLPEAAKSRLWPWPPTKAWYDVSPADHLERGQSELGLRGKLDAYLTSQSVDPAAYPQAYLVTAPRFLGYHFNPMSFWYLYSPERVLSAMVVEINNIFGERRAYLVQRGSEQEAKHVTGSASQSQERNDTPPQFAASWAKDFHVSPFNSRKGSYYLLTHDPFGAGTKELKDIDITLNLVSSKGHQKVRTKLFSNRPILNSSSMGLFQRLSFMMSWFWVGFVTFPRIVKEYVALFFRRELYFWYRPEPLKDTIGRQSGHTENKLEGIFRQYLAQLIEQSPVPLTVRYIASGVAELTEETFTSQKSTEDSGSAEHVELKVLTPAFYTRFVHYAHDFEGIFSELVDNRTIWVDRPEILPKIFLKKPAPPLQASGVMEFASFKLIQTLRRRPNRIERPLTSAQTTSRMAASDIRGFRISSLDAFVLASNNTKMKRAYRSSVLRLFLADWFSMGSTRLLDLAELAGRITVSWTLWRLLQLPDKD